MLFFCNSIFLFSMSLPSLLNLPVPDELVEHIKQFIRVYIRRSHVEIEAKIGILKNTRSQNRISHLNVNNLCLLSRAQDCYFDSSLSQSVFFKLKELLDTRKGNNVGNIKFERIFEIDQFYEVVGLDEKVRVSVDLQGKVLQVLEKKKLEHFDFYNPQGEFDFRLTAAVEEPSVMTCIMDDNAGSFVPGNREPQFVRNKNRHSYFFDKFRIDMTEVSQVDKSRGFVCF